MNKTKYGIVIAAYNPPSTLFGTLKLLSLRADMRVYVVDSSPEATSAKIQNYIHKNNSLVNQFSKDKPLSPIKYFKVPNYGVGYTFNFGIKQAIEDGCDLITLFTDDVKLDDAKFSVEKIRDFFYKNSDSQRDVLILPFNNSQLQRVITKTVDSGMTFSKELFAKIKFREELIFDQTDTYFCFQVIAKGGKFIVYPEIVIEVLPIGREIKNGEYALPVWRLYLVTRNVICIDLEGRKKLKALQTDAYPEIRHWSNLGIKCGQNVLVVLRAVFLGFIDGVSGKLGVTNSLQKLSGNRFFKQKS